MVSICKEPGRATSNTSAFCLPGTTKENDFCHQHSPYHGIIAQFSMINGFHLGEAENENSGAEAATRLGVFTAATRVEGREIWPVPAGRALYLLFPARLGRHCGEKKHMAFDMHLQKQSESCNLVMHCLLFHLCSLPNIMNEKLFFLDLPKGVSFSEVHN